MTIRCNSGDRGSVRTSECARDIRSALDNAPSKVALQVPVDVESELLEPGQPPSRPGTPERLTEVRQGGRKLIVSG